MKQIAMMLAGAAVSMTIAGAGMAQTPELGRLFFTPEQRAALDARRKARVPDKPAATPVAESPVTLVNGAVQRSGGKSTVWVNGEMIAEDAQADGARLTSRGPKTGSVSIPEGENAPRRELRVGESLDRGSGEVRDLVGEGGIRIGPRRTAPGKK